MITCSCCGNLRGKENSFILIRNDMSILRVCTPCVNGMWRKFNPDIKAERDAIKAKKATSSSN